MTCAKGIGNGTRGLWGHIPQQNSSNNSRLLQMEVLSYCLAVRCKSRMKVYAPCSTTVPVLQKGQGNQGFVGQYETD